MFIVKHLSQSHIYLAPQRPGQIHEHGNAEWSVAGSDLDTPAAAMELALRVQTFRNVGRVIIVDEADSRVVYDWDIFFGIRVRMLPTGTPTPDPSTSNPKEPSL